MTTPPDMIWLDLTQHAQGYTADPTEAREGDIAFVPYGLARAWVAAVVLAISSRFDEAEAEDILAMTPADAQAALARMLADARRDGRKEGMREAAGMLLPAPNSKGGLWANRLERRRIGILAAAEKETEHE